MAGFVGGIQAGYNWRLSGGIIAGVEVDLSGSAADGTDSKTIDLPFSDGGRTLLTTPLTTSLESELKWFSTVRGRIGFLPTSNLMVYATGGLAFGKVEHRLTAGTGTSIDAFVDSQILLSCPASSPCLAGSSSKTSTGWTAGGGFELALTNGVSLKGEYLFVDLGEATVTALPTQSISFSSGLPVREGAFLRAETETKFHVLRTGLNFKF